MKRHLNYLAKQSKKKTQNDWFYSISICDEFIFFPLKSSSIFVSYFSIVLIIVFSLLTFISLNIVCVCKRMSVCFIILLLCVQLYLLLFILLHTLIGFLLTKMMTDKNNNFESKYIMSNVVIRFIKKLFRV